MTATPRQIGPYRQDCVMVAGGDESAMSEVVLLCDDAPIGVLINSGTGGANLLRPKCEAGGGVVREFETHAQQWNAGAEYAGIVD